MSIPEQQLDSWSGLGAQKGSEATYRAVRAALAAHSWPGNMNWDVYLQGSYPNTTNIRGDSDVDVVVESSNVFYHDTVEPYRSQLGLTGNGSYNWQDFRTQVRAALSKYFDSNSVADSASGKCIKVAGNSSRLAADVVPCITFKRYLQTTHIATGITFWDKSGNQIVNYPKAHLNNGSTKNSECNRNYKPNVRVFKNARNKAENDFPSYFVESLLYNVPSGMYSSTYSSTFANALNFFHQAANDGSLARFRCQNEQLLMFGNGQDQVPLRAGEYLISDLIALWNNW